MSKLENRFSLISQICAAITVLAGVLAFIGWSVKIPSLVQLTPQAFIQANTSICFILSGAALFLLNKAHFSFTRILSILVLLIAGTTLLEYLLKLNLGIDELLFKDFILEGTSHPNRMAPNTALCFFLLGIIFIISTYSLNKNKGNLLIAILGAVVFFLASIALSGFLVGLEEAFGWGQMTPMSPQTAITFLIASLGLISLAWKSAVQLAKGFPVWASSFASLAVIVIFIGIWQSLVMGERQFINADMKIKHDSMVSKILFELTDRTHALERMGKRFEFNFPESERRLEWEQDALNYIDHYEGLETISWIDSDYHLRWIKGKSPTTGDLNLKILPLQAQTMGVSREIKEAQISHVLTNPQGQKFLYIFVPLFLNNNFLGFLRGEFSAEKILGIGMGGEKSEIQTTFSDSRGIFFQNKVGDLADQKHWVYSSEIEYRGLDWFVQCKLSQVFLSEMRSNIPGVVMGFGLILAWALGTAVRSGQRAREHELELTITNEKLEEEFERGREQQAALEVSKIKYKKLFSQVKSIIEEISSERGDDFYALLVEKVSSSLGFKYCLVGELDPLNDRKVNVLAICQDSHKLENFSYELAGTPCENVVDQGLCALSDNVWRLFPEDKILKELGIESYVGIPLNDSDNSPLGILVAMHDGPIVDLENAKLILPLFADIAQSEMERQIFERELQWESKKVQISRDIAVASNDLPDAESTLIFVLEKLCKFIGWPVGHLYLIEDLSSTFVPTRYWHFESPERYKILKEVTENTSFEIGSGLPGRVAKTKRPEWIRDVYLDEDFPRARKSGKLGIHSALACPIMVRKDVVGVMEFFTPKVLVTDWEVMALVEQVGLQIGRVLERKKSEEELREQAEVLDKIHDAVISLDLSLNITGWNQGAEHIFHYKQDEVMSKPVSTLFEIPKEILKEQFFLPAQIKENHEVEVKAMRKGGEEFFVHLSLSMLCGENCKPRAFVCYALDITEKKLAQIEREKNSQNLKERVEQRTEELNKSLSEIRKAKSQTEGILKSIGEGLIVTDLEGTIVLMNLAAEKILSLEVKEALGKEADQVIENQILLSQILSNDDKESSEEPFEFELSEDSESLEKKFIQGVSTVIRNEQDALVGSVTVLRDITFERKVDNLKSQFLSTAAHELRTPLTTLQGFSEILLQKKGLPAESVNKFLRYINEESLKLGRIINDFLDISRIESGREIALDKKNYAVADTIERSMKLFGEANKASHEFVFQGPSQPVKWKVDLEKMEQVFKNLYSNAAKYSPKGGKITTSVHSVNNHTEVVVEDQGMGMTEDEVANVFNKFYRGKSVDKNIHGSGLGMTIVKYILEAHGGSIKVESELGQGTRVIMSVPNS
jgi:PAS domain S-box-containing protein